MRLGGWGLYCEGILVVHEKMNLMDFEEVGYRCVSFWDEMLQDLCRWGKVAVWKYLSPV